MQSIINYNSVITLPDQSVEYIPRSFTYRGVVFEIEFQHSADGALTTYQYVDTENRINKKYLSHTGTCHYIDDLWNDEYQTIGLIPIYVVVDDVKYTIGESGCGYTDTVSGKSIVLHQTDDLIFMESIHSIHHIRTLDGMDPKTKYVIMDLYDGTMTDITQIIRSYSEKQKIEIVLQLLDACIYYKNNNLYYHTLHPDNILYKYYGNAIKFVFGSLDGFIEPDEKTPTYHTYKNQTISCSKLYEDMIIWNIMTIVLYLYGVDIVPHTLSLFLTNSPCALSKSNSSLKVYAQSSIHKNLLIDLKDKINISISQLLFDIYNKYTNTEHTFDSVKNSFMLIYNNL